MKNEKEYLIRASVVVETNCLPILGMMNNFLIPNIAMLRWIAYLEFSILLGKIIMLQICYQKQDMILKKT
jgi:hypothetical protein